MHCCARASFPFPVTYEGTHLSGSGLYAIVVIIISSIRIDRGVYGRFVGISVPLHLVVRMIWMGCGRIIISEGWLWYPSRNTILFLVACSWGYIRRCRGGGRRFGIHQNHGGLGHERDGGMLIVVLSRTMMIILASMASTH